MSSPSTVSVDNDLSTGQTSITLRTTNDESAGRLDVVDGSVVQEVLGDDSLDDLLQDLGSEVLSGDLLGVLSRDDDGVDSDRNDGSVGLLLVLDSDLGLGVGSEPSERTVSSSGSHGGVELVGEGDGQRHHLGCLVGSVTEPGSELSHSKRAWGYSHDTLVTGTDLLKGTVVETSGNLGGLLLNGNEDVTGLVVETLVRVVVTNLLDGVSDDGLVVDLGLGGDLTKDLNISLSEGACIEWLTMIIPVLVAVSQATLEKGSWAVSVVPSEGYYHDN